MGTSGYTGPVQETFFRPGFNQPKTKIAARSVAWEKKCDFGQFRALNKIFYIFLNRKDAIKHFKGIAKKHATFLGSPLKGLA